MNDQALDDLLQSAWGGITPYIMPLILLAVLCLFRVRVAEWFAEAYYVFIRKHQKLMQENTGEENGGDEAAGSDGSNGFTSAWAERLERFWDAVCNWNDACRDAVNADFSTASPEGVSKLHIASGLLALNIEKTLPFLPPELRITAEEVARECARQRALWQTAQGSSEKREAMLKDAVAAYAKLDRRIREELQPSLENVLRASG